MQSLEVGKQVSIILDFLDSLPPDYFLLAILCGLMLFAALNASRLRFKSIQKKVKTLNVGAPYGVSSIVVSSKKYNRLIMGGQFYGKVDLSDASAEIINVFSVGEGITLLNFFKVAIDGAPKSEAELKLKNCDYVIFSGTVVNVTVLSAKSVTLKKGVKFSGCIAADKVVINKGARLEKGKIFTKSLENTDGINMNPDFEIKLVEDISTVPLCDSIE